MRASLLVLVLLLVPLAAADTERGSGVGLNLGITAVGTWEIYTFSWPGSAVFNADIRLSAAQPPGAPVIHSDYNLLLYAPGSWADRELDDGERIAQSVTRGGAAERILVPLAAASDYVIVVAPYQTQNEGFTLTTNGGTTTRVATAIGTQSFS